MLDAHTVSDPPCRPSRHAVGRAASAGPGPRARVLPALQLTDRRGLRPLDPRVRALPRQAPPARDGRPQVEAFLSWPSTERGVSVSTHRQALSARLFLYQQVLGQQLPWMGAIGRPQRTPRLPVVLSPAEVAAVLAGLEGTHRVLGQLLYGTGMRIAKALQLRVKDVEFDRRVIVVRHGKGGKDRVVMLPATLAPGLREQMKRVRVLWEADARAGRGGVQMPGRSNASTRAPAPRGSGSGLFHRLTTRYVCARGASAATTCSTRRSSVPSSAPCTPPASNARLHRTRCATASLPTCCRRAPTSEPCRNCSATPTSARR